MIWYSTGTFNFRLNDHVKGRRQLGEEAFRRLTSIAISVEVAENIRHAFLHRSPKSFADFREPMPSVKRVLVCAKLRNFV
jgi:hypothetical protein